MNIRKTILAGAIATVMAAPAFAAENAPYQDASEAPAKTEPASPMGDQPTTKDSMNQPQNKDQTPMTAAKDPVQDNPLYARSAESLDGVDIVDTAGEEIGSIKNIVLAKDRRSAHAVVSTGGMMGIGTREVLVSFDELKPVGDKVLQINTTQKQLEARQKYESERYVELDGDKPIGGSIAKFSALETQDQPRNPALAPESIQ